MVLQKCGINSYRLQLPVGCRLHPVFHCDLLSHATSAASLRPHPAEIEGDHDEYAIDYIADVKIDKWPRRRGAYLQFLTHFVGYEIHEWMLLEQDDDCEQLSTFLTTEKWKLFSLSEDYLTFRTKFPARDIEINK